MYSPCLLFDDVSKSSVTANCVFQVGGVWGSDSGPYLNCVGQPILNIKDISGPDAIAFGVVDPSNGNISVPLNWAANISNYQKVDTKSVRTPDCSSNGYY